MINDLYGSALPSLYPVFIALYGLSYALTGLYTTAFLLASAFLQPIFGYLFDKLHLRILLPISLLLGATGISLVGLFRSFELNLLFVAIAGLGPAIYHPVASAYSSYKSEKRGLLFSIFMIGGRIGAAIGPLIALFLYNLFGLPGLIFFIAPCLPFLHALYTLSGSSEDVESSSSIPQPAAGVKSRAIMLIGFLVMASGVGAQVLSIGVTYFLAPLAVDMGFGKEFGAILLTINFIGAIIGVPLLSHLSDIRGRYLVSIALLLTASLITPLIVIPNQSLMMTLIAFRGAALTSLHTILILILHELMPSRKGLASSLIYGIAFGVSGLTAPLVGYMIDLMRFDATFQALALLGFASTGLLIAANLLEKKNVLL